MRAKPQKSSLKRTSSFLEREASPELGDDTKFVKVNSKTGKPMRASAGKRTSIPDYFVASNTAIDYDDEDDDSLSESPEIVGDTVIVPKVKRRRVSPPPPELSPEPESDIDADNDICQRRNSQISGNMPPKELALTFNVPSGHVGPFIVKIDLASLSGAAMHMSTPLQFPNLAEFNFKDQPAEAASSRKRKAITLPNKSRKKSKNATKTSFLDLPPEIRNVIYRQVFCSKPAIDFRHHTSFSHAGGFLSTCRAVYHEGTDILYGDNEFKFSRDAKKRGTFWNDWTEVGWRDVRRFLTGIGGNNISKIRKLSITFEDPTHKDHHNPHFTDDDHLMDCLKLLANYGQLQTLSLAIHGKAMVKKTNARFLENLKAIRADKCEIYNDPGVRRHGYYRTWYGGRRIANVVEGLDKEIVAKIQRKQKLYEKVEEDDWARY